jgi:hypothetical protein
MDLKLLMSVFITLSLESRARKLSHHGNSIEHGARSFLKRLCSCGRAPRQQVKLSRAQISQSIERHSYEWFLAQAASDSVRNALCAVAACSGGARVVHKFVFSSDIEVLLATACS